MAETRYRIVLDDEASKPIAGIAASYDKLAGASSQFAEAASRGAGQTAAALETTTQAVSALGTELGSLTAPQIDVSALSTEIQSATDKIPEPEIRPSVDLSAVSSELGKIRPADLEPVQLRVAPFEGLSRADAAVSSFIDTAAAKFDSLRSRAASAAADVRDRVSTSFAEMRERISVVAERVSTSFAAAAAKVRSRFDALRDGAGSALTSLRDRAGSAFAAAAEKAETFASRVAASTERTRASLSAIGERALSPFRSALERVRGPLSSFASKARTAFRSVVDGAKTSAGASGALGKLSSVLGKMRGALGAAASGFQGLIAKMRSAQSGAKDAGSGFSSMMASFKGNLLAMATAGLAKLGGAAVGAVANFAQFGEKARFALGALSRGRAPAEKLLEHSSALARRFGLDIQATQEQYTSFIRSGATPKIADTLTRLSADFRAVGNEVAGGKLAEFIREVGTKGGLIEIGQIDQLKELNISREGFAEAIAKATGETGPIDLEAKIKEGSLKPELIAQALETAANAALGQSKAGELGARFADETVTGIVGKLKAQAEGALTKTLEGATSAAAKALAPAVDRFSKFIESPEGQKALAKISDFLTKAIELGGVFADSFGSAFVDTLTEIKKAAEPLLEAFGGGKGVKAEAIVRALGKAFGVVAAIATAVVVVFGAITAAAAVLQAVLFSVVEKIAGGIIEGLGRIVFGITDWWANLVAIWDGESGSFLEKALALGEHIVTGIVDGIKGAGGLAVDAIKGLGTSMLSAFEETLGIESPSKVFAASSFEIGRGTASGVEESTPLAASASEEMARSTIEGAEKGFGKGPSFDVAEMSMPEINARSLGVDVLPRVRFTSPGGSDSIEEATLPAYLQTAPEFGLGTPDAPGGAVPKMAPTPPQGKRGASAKVVQLQAIVNVEGGTTLTTEAITEAAELGGRRAIDKWLLEAEQEG